jgi:hypothetical protein
MGLICLARVCHEIAKEHGFWPDHPRNRGEQIALMHEELSGILEGLRKPRPDTHCPDFTREEVKLADLIIRALDYAHGHGLRLTGALRAKVETNETRPHLHGKTF